jgi:NitT/TauT family transport system substrate-binding protein
MKIKTYFLALSLILFSALFSLSAVAAEKTVIRLGVLAFGTLEWELAALKNEHLLDNADFEIQAQTLASPQAAEVALQAGAVDMIVSDWIWTSRMRASGADFSFYPYSNTSGALVVPANSPIKTLKDLSGKKLGIAGGELDKNWLLLQALANQQQVDLKSTTPAFGAPPLLNQQLAQGRVDAVLNYWHFAARLEAQGYKQILDGKAILTGLGIKEEVPSLGYVFKQSWANQHKAALEHFFAATKQAKDKLCSDNTVWKKIAPLTKAEDDATQTKLHDRYCAGRVTDWGTAQQQAAGQIYTLLRKLSNNKLTGTAETIQTGTFWMPK